MTPNDLKPLSDRLNAITQDVIAPVRAFVQELAAAGVYVEADVDTELPWTHLAWMNHGGNWALALTASEERPRPMSEWSRVEYIVAARAFPALVEALHAAIESELECVASAQRA